jgi:hypothetical protein
MKPFISFCLLYVSICLSALAQSVHISPDKEWYVIEKSDKSSQTLISRNSNIKKDLTNLLVLGFTKDSKSLIVAGGDPLKVQEWQVDDLQAVSQIECQKQFGKRKVITMIYLPKSNCVIFFLSRGPLGTKVCAESIDWTTKQKIASKCEANLKYFNEEAMRSETSMANYRSFDIDDDEKRAIINFSVGDLNTGQFNDVILALNLETLTVEAAFQPKLPPASSSNPSVYIPVVARISSAGDIIGVCHNVFDNDSQQYKCHISYWNAGSGQFIKKQAWAREPISLSDIRINEKTEVIVFGLFTRETDKFGETEPLRKIDIETGKVLTSYRGTLNDVISAYTVSKQMIVFRDRRELEFTPFDIKTWSKENPIKL